MQNLTCNQTQQISGGTFGVATPQLQQLAILTGFIVPKALIGAGLSLTKLNPNGLAANVIKEAASVAVTGIAMVAGNHFFQEAEVMISKNQTIVLG